MSTFSSPLPQLICQRGADGHARFVDGARGLSVAALTNTLYESMSGRFVAGLRDAVYGSAYPAWRA